MRQIIVTGCERSGTTFIAKEIAKEKQLPYVHERYAKSESVMKHSLNMNQNIKHLELLDHLYPDAKWYFVIRDGREVCRSIVQKIWKRVPHTMSLNDAILQWNHVNQFIGFNNAEIIRYESFVKNPIEMWKEYFTTQQKDYLNQRLHLDQYGY